MLANQHLITGSLTSSVAAFLTVAIGVDSPAHKELQARIETVSKTLDPLSLTNREFNKRIWNDQSVRSAYQITIQKDVLRLSKLMIIFPLANFFGSLVGELINKHFIEKNPSNTEKKRQYNIVINPTIAALFTLCITKSTKLSVINGIATVISQLIIPNPIKK